jgi:hypothetical protein
MKTKLAWKSGWIALAVTILVLAYYSLFFITGETTTNLVDEAHMVYGPELGPGKQDTMFGGLFIDEYNNDSLPHYLYKRKTDSIKAIKDSIALQNKSFALGHGNEFIGVGYIRKEKQNDSLFNDITYYLKLPGYSLLYPNQFFMIGNRYYITTVQQDPVSKTYHYARRQIPVRYSSDQKEVLIPVSPGVYRTLNVVMIVLIFILIIVSIYVLLGLPIQLLINISKGNAFTLKNIRILRLIAITLFSLTTLNIVAPYLLRLLFSRYVPEEFHLEPFWNVFGNKLTGLFLSVAVFIISMAFKRGYDLQQEQELTV